ncbi:hypothetical protein C5167_000273 [Papaver somniferum]|uniref:C2H2-type domain-containing protein n=1 Tax=Papaver somniferum TaxID=3469 RepID=A0A4Y7KRX6_PAPSO|nr:hypothetical protein C5167_000273 [Papaver somniferum]
MEDNTANMATCLMLLSRNGGGDQIDYRPFIQAQTISTSSKSRVYECKTCNRQFPSFQALGGHRASHKKPKLADQVSSDDLSSQQQVTKPKIHECSICGLEFAIGQALGGHMRRHRAAMLESSLTTTKTAVLSPSSSDITTDTTEKQQVPVFKRSNSSRRILGLNLDLNISDPLPTTTTKDSNDFDKRCKGEMKDNIAKIATCLMLLSRSGGDQIDYRPVIQAQTISTSTRGRVYECKTCSRQFPSFQALGGHRASHKKPKLVDQLSADDLGSQQQVTKPKIHECSICGLEFAIGQALGGNMRKHRSAMIESSLATTKTEVLSPSSSDITTDNTTLKQQVPVFKRSNSSRRILVTREVEEKSKISA